MAPFVSASPRVETDYQARFEFLRATSEVMRPAPIDELLANVAPLLKAWLAHLRGVYGEPVDTMRVSFALAGRMIPESDDSIEAAEVRSGISAWMKRFDFRDSWIAEAAVTTLFVHVSGHAASRGWYTQPPWWRTAPGGESVYADKSNVPERMGTESTHAYALRIDRELRSFERPRLGTRVNQRAPARWTALRFIGKTFPEIAAENSLPEDSTPRKAVRAFVTRAGLTLPSRQKGRVTLADSLAGSHGKAGINREYTG